MLKKRISRKSTRTLTINQIKIKGKTMYQTAILPNGLKIICETIPLVHSVSLGIWVGTGSRYEKPENNGISHFVEHMLFKGTANRTTRQIAETIDAVGGQLNAFTTKEYTCYYAKVLSRHFSLGLDLLADMVLNSVIETSEIEKEKSVVAEELKSYEDSPDELVHELFVGQVLKGHSLGRNILGTPETVARLTRGSLFSYLKQYYTPDNMVFAVAGNIQFNQVITEIENKFAGLKGNVTKIYEAIPPLVAETILKFKETEQVYLCIGTRGVPRKDPQKFAVLILDGILGGSVSSRLFQRLREEKGLVYETGSNHSSFNDTGIFTVYAGTSPVNCQVVAALIKEEIAAFCENLVDTGELARAKEQLKGNLLLSLESTCNRMSRLAKLVLFNEELVTPEEAVAKIEAVTADSVREAARRIFYGDRLITAAIGPFKEPAEIGW